VKPDAPSGFYYSNHEKTQGEVARDLENTPFSDLLIADLDGFVLYSYKKNDDFAENLKSDAWKSTGAGLAFAKAIENTAKANDDARLPASPVCASMRQVVHRRSSTPCRSSSSASRRA
jgi:methyl-accepting chemotaxis protein